MIMRQLEIDKLEKDTEVYNIVEQHIQKMESIKERSRQEIGLEVDAFIQNISTQIPPEKAEKLKEKMKRFKKRKRRSSNHSKPKNW